MSKMKTFIFVFICLSFATCLIKNEEVIVTLNGLSVEYTGKKGTLAISTSSEYTFKEDISRKIYFESKIANEKSTYNSKCGFWKASEDKFYVFCNIDTDIPAGRYTIDFTGISQFDYQGKSIKFSDSRFNFEKLDKDLIDLYSDKQEINIVEGQDSYELKFNVVSYNQEVLFFSTRAKTILECKQENKELICPIKKDELEKGFEYKSYSLSIRYIGEKEGEAKLPLTGPIILTDNIAQKTDVYIRITKLLENVMETNSFITYETNVTNINKVMTSIEHFSLEFENDKGKTESSGCLFKKNDGFPLFIVCFVIFDGTSWLKEIKNKIEVDEANIRYNFRILPGKNEDKIYSGGEGSPILWSYPEILDFTKADTLYIDLDEDVSSDFKLTFNENKPDLSCAKRDNRLLRCTVPSNHFEGKQSGYYFIKHTNFKNTKSTNYESTPVKVIVSGVEPKPGKGSIHKISLVYSLLLILSLF